MSSEDMTPQEQELLAYLEDLQANNPAEYELLVQQMREKSDQAGSSGPRAGGEQVTPSPGFVAKTRSATNQGAKVFINVCQSEHVDKPAPVPAAADSEEVQMRIPLSLGPPREDLDKSGEVCTVYDVVFHPDAVSGALGDEEFRSFVMQLTLHQIQQKYKDELSADVTFPKVRGNYKGIAPLPQYMRKKGAPPPPPPGSKEAIEAEAAAADEASSSAKKPLVEEVAPPPVEALPTPSYSVERRTAGGTAHAEIEGEGACARCDVGAAVVAGASDTLCIKVHLPAVEDASAIELSAHADGLELLVPGVCALVLSLPHAVRLPARRAAFEASRCILSVHLDVDRDAEIGDAIDRAAERVARRGGPHHATPTGGANDADAYGDAPLNAAADPTAGFTETWSARLEREREARQNARRKRAAGNEHLARQAATNANDADDDDGANYANDADDANDANAEPPPPQLPPGPPPPPPPPPFVGMTNSIMFELEEL